MVINTKARTYKLLLMLVINIYIPRLVKYIYYKMYKFIVNPDTGRRVGINTKKGKQIILNYMIMLGGSSNTNEDLVNFNILVTDALDLLDKKIDGGFMGYHEAMLDEWEQFYEQAKNNTSIDSDVVKNKAYELFDDIDSHLAATGSSLKVRRSLPCN